MTTDQFIAAQQKKIDAIIKEDIPLRRAVANVMALQSKRIFKDAKNADGNIIGNYIKPRPMYFSEKTRLKTNLPSFPLAGKTGETKFKNGKPHVSGYFGNFLEFKEAIGRNEDVKTVDLFLTGELHRHWANNNSDQKNSPAQAKKVNQHNYIVAISSKDEDKISRYPRVFNLSLSEREAFLKTIKNQLAIALK